MIFSQIGLPVRANIVSDGPGDTVATWAQSFLLASTCTRAELPGLRKDSRDEVCE